MPDQPQKQTNKHFQQLVLLSCLLTFMVVGLGAYTRLSDAGLGCPDWPGCYGFLSVPNEANEMKQVQREFGHSALANFATDKAWKEMIHRYFAGTLGLLFLAILVVAIRRSARMWRDKIRPGTPVAIPILLALLVLFQAFLGMLTVTLQLQPIIVMGHLLGGFTLLSLSALLYLTIRHQRLALVDPPMKSYLPFAVMALVVLVLQIALGGWLAANYAAAVCPGLPLCSPNGNDANLLQHFSLNQAFQLPLDAGNYEYGVLSAEARISIHVLHRLWAVVTTIVLLVLAARIFWQSHSAKIKNSALAVAIAVLLQISLGAILVYTQFPLSMALAHNLMAALLLLTMIRLIFYIHKSQSGGEQKAQLAQE